MENGSHSHVTDGVSRDVRRTSLLSGGGHMCHMTMTSVFHSLSCACQEQTCCGFALVRWFILPFILRS